MGEDRDVPREGRRGVIVLIKVGVRFADKLSRGVKGIPKVIEGRGATINCGQQ